jgi:hypothetical protein
MRIEISHKIPGKAQCGEHPLFDEQMRVAFHAYVRQ